MAFTLRLDEAHEAALERLAKRLGVSRTVAVHQAIMMADKSPSHPRLVKTATKKILERDAAILKRLAGS